MPDSIFQTQEYSATIIANSSPEKAFEKISRVDRWWTGNFLGSAAKKSDRFTVRFDDTHVDFLIEEMVLFKKFSWLVTDCNLPWLMDKKEWKGTMVEFEIRQVIDQVEIRMTHRGLVPGIECFDRCEKGWDFFIKQSLVQLLNTGKGLPDMPGNQRG